MYACIFVEIPEIFKNFGLGINLELLAKEIG